jgi:LysR family hca operon transcriptional activator
VEFRRFRYFVAVAEAGSFVEAARRLKVAQPALSKQVRELETELGVPLFVRVARGVELTPAGHAFLAEARLTLGSAARAMEVARQAAAQRSLSLHFAHGELLMYAAQVAELLAAFGARHGDVQVSSLGEAELLAALRDHRVDVAAAFVTTWPVDGFEGLRLVSVTATGVLLSARHPLAAKPAIRLRDLQDLTFAQMAGSDWPDVYRAIHRALKVRGLVPKVSDDVSPDSADLQIAAGDAWALANERSAASSTGSSTIVYRPFVDPPIPSWLALLWKPDAPPLALKLVGMARERGLSVEDEAAPVAIAG